MSTKRKMEILYVEDDVSIAEIYSVMMKEIFPDATITIIYDGIKAIEELKKYPIKYSLIVSDYKLNSSTGADLFKFANGQMLGIPFAILSGWDCSDDEKFKDFYTSHVRNTFLVKPIDMDNLADKLNWCLDSENDLLKIYQKNATNFDEKIAISSSIFIKLNIIPCDVFLKLSDGKFVKIINKNEIFESVLIKKLFEKGVTQFYVNRSELSIYANTVASSLNLIIKTQKKGMDDLQKSKLTNRGLDIIKGQLLKCGFNKSLLQTSDEVINIQLELIEKSPEIQQFFKKFNALDRSNTNHTRLVCYVIVSILKDLQWDSDSTVHRMCLAGILHDLPLPESLIDKNLFQDDLESLTEEEKELYIRHTEEASHLAKNFEIMSGGIGQYILEHHELPDGRGFPQKLNFNHVHPLSAVLHIADLIAHLFWKFDFNQEEVFEALKEKRTYYARGFYRKPYESLYRIMKLNLN